MDKRLIIIDPGHGGEDPGASNQGHHEKDVVLQLALLFEEFGKELYDVRLTRITDEFLPLHDRTNLTRVLENVDLFISFHCNGSDDEEAYGQETYHADNRNSEILALALLGTLSNTGSKHSRGVKYESIEVLRESKAKASALVEFEFITNNNGLKLLLDPKQQELYVEAMLKGVDNYFKTLKL